jgi:hypothetical protein
MTQLPFRHRRETPDCGIRTHATVETSLSAVAALRDAPPPTGGPALPPRLRCLPNPGPGVLGWGAESRSRVSRGCAVIHQG